MKKKILVKGPVLSCSGYGVQSRFALKALRSREDLFDIHIQPIQWGKTSWLSVYDEERAWIDEKIENTLAHIEQGGHFDMSLQITIPNEFSRIAPVNIGYTAGIETTKIAHQWIQKSNEMDKVIVVSNHSKHVFETTEYEAVNKQTEETTLIKTHTPVEAVNYPVRTYDNLPDLSLDLEYDVNFLCVAQMGPRKNLFNTIKWFVEEFKEEKVGLVVKTNLARNCLSDREHVFEHLRGFLSETAPERTCKVYLLHGDMTNEEIHSLYRHEKISAFTCLTHGEGFGLPFFEAAYSGIPVVAPSFSGQLDFLCDTQGKEHFYSVAYDLRNVQKEVVWDGVIIAESMWAYAREQSSKDMLRQCYNDVLAGEGLAKRAKDYAEELKERFSAEKMYEAFVNSVLKSDPVDQLIDLEKML